MIIPTRNRADKLARALASVAGQTDAAAEILVVDDGSRSEDASQIAALVERTPGARLLREAHGVGAARARNLAAAAARGSLLAFLDSDDWWSPERLAAHRVVLEQAGTVLSYNPAWLTRSGAGNARGPVGRPPPRRWPLSVALAGWNFVGSCSSVCVSAAAFRRAGGFDPELPSCQDWDLWLRLSRHGRFAFIPEPLTYLDVGPHPRITTSGNAVEAGHARVHARAAAIPTTAAERRYVTAEHCWTLAEIESRFGRRGTAVPLMLRSLLARPTARALERAPALLAASLVNRGGGCR